MAENEAGYLDPKGDSALQGDHIPVVSIYGSAVTHAQTTRYLASFYGLRPLRALLGAPRVHRASRSMPEHLAEMLTRSLFEAAKERMRHKLAGGLR